MTPFLSPDQLAQTLQLSRDTIYRKMRSGELRAVKVAGQWRVSQEAFEEWVGGGAAPYSEEESPVAETSRTPLATPLRAQPNKVSSLSDWRALRSKEDDE